MLGFKSLVKLCPADGPLDAARQPTMPSSCKRNRINAPSAGTGPGASCLPTICATFRDFWGLIIVADSLACRLGHTRAAAPYLS
jgi:hypothetical protein